MDHRYYKAHTDRYGQIDKMDEWMDGWMDGWMDE